LLQTASNDHIDTLSKQIIMNTHKAKVASDGVFKAKKQIGERKLKFKFKFLIVFII
jgi:hypothetical protein